MPSTLQKIRTDPRVEYVDLDVDQQAAIDALVSLVRDNIPTDVQELLVRGDPERGIRSGALSRAIKAAMMAYIVGQITGHK